jgi:hypothetical protein
MIDDVAEFGEVIIDKGNQKLGVRPAQCHSDPNSLLKL